MIKDRAKIRVCIDGIALQTTAGNIRRGAISHCLFEAWCAFEAEHIERNVTGRAASYWDRFTNRDHMIQIDLY